MTSRMSGADIVIFVVESVVPVMRVTCLQVVGACHHSYFVTRPIRYTSPRRRAAMVQIMTFAIV
jgi:hypothetical protein